ncbi:hypothetical protein XELAEV_18046272mg [Xenopus laevis]|uniref:Uncharacterized protein n=1 Tax=Xenopus laevis TaxID=8355 RepID=A0A974H0G5_XENLA|nr:hypothetical protein XELAEV_18046272mg [Xenopus laevis]
MGTYLWVLHKLGYLPVGINYQAWALTCGYYLSYGIYLLALITKHGHLPVDVTTCWHGIPSMSTYLWVLHKSGYLPVGINYKAWAHTCGYYMN